MSLFSDVPISNITVTRRDYKRKKQPREKPILPVRDYPDPLSGPYEEHLQPYRKYNALPKPTSYPDPKEYVEKVCEHIPGLKPYLKDPDGPNFDVIDRLYDNDNRSEYMVSYCRLGDYESKLSQSRKTRPVPDGWEIPLTTQRCSYRPVARMASVRGQRVPDSLVPNEREREILGVKTGESDYMAFIGRTGEEIIDGKLHGDVNMRPQFSQDELLRAMLIRRQ